MFTVGKFIAAVEFVFAEERNNLFPISLKSTTIEDSD